MQKPALTVTTAKPQTSKLPIKLCANGNVAAWQEAIIGSESNGLRLTDVRVNVGDVVRAGQVLAVFSSDTVNADVAQTKAAVLEAEANAAEASANAARARSLQTTGAISAQQISQYLTAEQTANARIASSQGAAGGAAAAPEIHAGDGARQRRDLVALGHRRLGGGRRHGAVPHDPPGPPGMARRSDGGRTAQFESRAPWPK